MLYMCSAIPTCVTVMTHNLWERLISKLLLAFSPSAIIITYGQFDQTKLSSLHLLEMLNMDHFISITWSSVSETLYIYNPLLPTITIIPPAFDTRPDTAGDGGLRRADASSGSWGDPAIAPIDVGADPPGGRVSVDSQIVVGARGVLQHLQTVNVINNVNICQTHMCNDSWIDDNC